MPPFNPRELAISAQGPGQAFTRYLSQMQGRGQMSSPIRDLLEERGRYLSYLAPLGGQGIGEDLGGKGQSFSPYYEQQGMQTPKYGEVSGQLRGIQGMLDKQRTPGTDAQGNQTFNDTRSNYETALSGAYEDPEDQLRAHQAGAALQVNPYFRTGLTRNLGRRYEQQQANDPNSNWLQYAMSNGLI